MGDYDSDGNLDIVTVHGNAKTVKFHKGTGDGKYEEGKNLLPTPSGVGVGTGVASYESPNSAFDENEYHNSCNLIQFGLGTTLDVNLNSQLF